MKLQCINIGHSVQKFKHFKEKYIADKYKDGFTQGSHRVHTEFTENTEGKCRRHFSFAFVGENKRGKMRSPRLPLRARLAMTRTI